MQVAAGDSTHGPKSCVNQWRGNHCHCRCRDCLAKHGITDEHVGWMCVVFKPEVIEQGPRPN